jgi:hypothetical protein
MDSQVRFVGDLKSKLMCSASRLANLSIVIRSVYTAKPGLTAYYFPSFLGES